MSDLSKPNEASEWAWSWFNDAEHPNYNASPELMVHRRGRAVARVQEAIARLSATQPARCAEGIAAMRGALNIYLGKAP